jgi:hypothetical protein
MTFLATASGLMMESVRSMAMVIFLGSNLKKDSFRQKYETILRWGKAHILTRGRRFPRGEKDLQTFVSVKLSEHDHHCVEDRLICRQVPEIFFDGLNCQHRYNPLRSSWGLAGWPL